MADTAQAFFKLRISIMSYERDIISSALNKWALQSRQEFNENDYILKVCGLEEYLSGNYQLIQFKYVYDCISKGEDPTFHLIGDNVPHPIPPVPPRKLNNHSPSVREHKSMYEVNIDNSYHIWNVLENYNLTVDEIFNLNLNDNTKINLFVGLYHGSKELCEIKKTTDAVVKGGSAMLKTTITFDVPTTQLPHMTRICFAVYTAKAKKNKFSKNLRTELPMCRRVLKFLLDNQFQDTNAIAWVNIPMFTFESRLRTGEQEFTMWPAQVNTQWDDKLNYIGTVAPNPQDRISTIMKFHLPNFNCRQPIYFPPFSKILEFAANHVEEPGSKGSVQWVPDESEMELLQQVTDRDILDLHEQDMDIIWLHRFIIPEKYPRALAKLLWSVKWNNHVDVARMQALLQIWPKSRLQTEDALELLDFAFPDMNVRAFAVDCLKSLSDDEVSLYLLQLVQVLKFETFLQCPLVEFLLKRAICNCHLGHQLFWLLRSEMNDISVSVRFGLILEIYLKVASDHLPSLIQQSTALNKLSIINQLVKSENYNFNDAKSKQLAKNDMITLMEQKSYTEVLTNLNSPLCPLHKLKSIRYEKFNIMNSKMRPLWLVWKNHDEQGEDIYVIYKNGDDLRQDMLTLQLIQVMDNIWQLEGLDLKMNPYRCLATGPKTGMIEVVLKSQTIAKIQQWYNKRAFDKKSLFEWLKKHHSTPESLEKAVEEFMLSCAGYCVATYVLGIGDRHNDNIMIKESGQMFHIDFGHFLGNFKSKFGVKRERVPFVLTTHFVYLITNGDKNQSNHERFKQYCIKAYLILRKRGHLLITLFMMMLSSGIPELSSIRDVNYLKETLALHLTEEEAVKQFVMKYQEALRHSWTTSLNWWFHMQAKENL